ncbi:MAG: TerB family tellurite resistance protein [Gemmatimonadota bacterium]|nr:MAG: TerB family tellurite resistance protein [Gemmatimonadota bacterium]
MSNRDEWTELHHLAYVYAAVASSDGEITNDELDVFCEKLHQWNPEIPADELMQIVMTAVAALGSDKERQEAKNLRESVQLVADVLDEEGRVAALDDLFAIAAADGAFMPGEGNLLVEIREAWGTGRVTRPHLGPPATE